MALTTPMKLHADLRCPATVDTSTLPWTASPAAGVERRLIERNGAEMARATSLVRYAPTAQFPEHRHPLGEEILVLEGVFGDQFGEYPAGTYLRNPPGSAHAPRTPEGCVIFVKLRHMDPDDPHRVVCDSAALRWRSSATQGLELMPLGGFRGERAAILRLAPETSVADHRHGGGMEALVLQGTLEEAGMVHPRGTWLRRPADSITRWSSASGCTVFVKSGHLRPARAASVTR
ncbi:cupin domain-containing protein [Oleiagrimonas sp.]|jgi:anti-sigma factor ChrR (cupin superfamily)|uniref:cupin domain-containing protein n=1 Tax=Oleiagrimonas sp. TaxID=2010330 RepID=UPI00261A756B|nr:cupin domain-containing protein [Oleiagrimonas sp.]MDA3915052.1 cupin domain-containing protein [Oleiagrimonas sp.]